MEAGRIVVGMDNSAASAAALEWAVGHTRAGGVVVAVSVCGIRTPNGGADVFHAIRSRRVHDAVTRVRLGGGVHVEESVLDGEPGPALVELAGGADGLVLGRHGYSRGGVTVLGSVIRHCLEHALCPVVVVPAEGRRAA
ncbi:universal stress protein [Saccharothrix algeriensis]|uniref:Nucleotide-binding universal stress UspA family protein n=2 Tax=Saccharothrix algeriensis TaxID=173560 RepID=A0ABS2S444_9PSEU|nr:universal stress protein [Saccharothrix algeriensis]MBM7809861.1 nucleotide-binding universal stress UspA family protein [Saccharothrix algeriensis]